MSKRITIEVPDDKVKDYGASWLVCIFGGEEHFLFKSECTVEDIPDPFTWEPPTKYVPDWVRWFGFNEEGLVFGMSEKPVKDIGYWATTSYDARWCEFGYVPESMRKHWAESLVERAL